MCLELFYFRKKASVDGAKVDKARPARMMSPKKKKKEEAIAEGHSSPNKKTSSPRMVDNKSSSSPLNEAEHQLVSSSPPRFTRPSPVDDSSLIGVAEKPSGTDDHGQYMKLSP
ncbi:hypothetical protein QJS10_CPA01g01570 [Acorus calamus]|uniref:Uncharacterized protein n=1 Tax=Acorus calamus TaxID=4465 RepID=A0AAV9FK54_ACOCL|nr:hypothetical protein QJS10_CPA01g01554 [Acorus calamus]KAK1327151.1 hypothetical protein QJS10_CPA01g01570 [Acorus calamus]